MTRYRVTDSAGNEVHPRDVVSDFRGQSWRFVGVELGPSPGRSAKVTVVPDGSDDPFQRRTFDAGVFRLVVTEVDG